MNEYLLIVVFIFISGIVVCTFLARYSSFKEGFQTEDLGAYDEEFYPVTTSEIQKVYPEMLPQEEEIFYDEDIMNEVSNQKGLTESSITGLNTNTNTIQNGDNYNHFTGDAYPTNFYGPNGESAKIINSSGAYFLVITDSNGTSNIYNVNNKSTSSSVQSNGASSVPANGNKMSLENIYYASDGGVAQVKIDDTGNYMILVTMPNGDVIVYTITNTQNMSSSMPLSNNAFPSSSYDPSSSTRPSFSVPASSIPYSSVQQSPFLTPTFDEASYSQNYSGSTQNYSGSAQNNLTPPSTGIPYSMIPQNKQDLYMLKSEVVPPVCPICPTVNVCPSSKNKECPPCQPCGRCPEPDFECKKVPNYNNISKNGDKLPMPILNDFSTFGM